MSYDFVLFDGGELMVKKAIGEDDVDYTTPTAKKFGAMIRQTNDDLCHGIVNRDYVAEALKRNTILAGVIELVEHRRVLKSGTRVSHEPELRGFILASKTDDDGIYLDVICANMFGGEMLKQFVEYAETVKAAKYVELSALPNVLGFYPRYGFQHRHTCSEVAPIRITDALATYLRFKKPIAEDAYAYPSVMEFMLELHALGFTAKATPECQDAKDAESFKMGKCADNGFKMRKCFETVGGHAGGHTGGQRRHRTRRLIKQKPKNMHKHTRSQTRPLYI